MDIGEIIRKLTGGIPPDDAILASAGPLGMPPVPSAGPATPPASPASAPGPAPGPPGPPPVGAAPQGAQTPLTNPTPSDQTPRMMQSPPDLANMYLALIKDNKNAAAMDSGASLIAAGFSNRPENRTALIQGAMGNKPGTSITADDILKLQKQQVENQALAIRQAAKKGLLGKYGLTRDSLDYLDASGKLDEVIKHHHTQNLVQGTDASNGQVSFYNATDGTKVADIGKPKAEEGEWVQGPNGLELRSKRGGQQMAPGIGTKPEEDQVKLAQINTERVAKGEAPIGMEEFLKTVKRDEKTEPNAQDNAALDRINEERKTAGQPPLTMEQFVKTVKRDQPQAPNAADQATLDAINADRKAANKPALTMEQFITSVKRDPRDPANAANVANLAAINAERPADRQMTMEHYLTKVLGQRGTTVNVGPNGQKFPDPKQGLDYKRNEDGTVYIDPATKEPVQYAIAGSAGANELRKGGAEASEAERKEKDAAEKKAKAIIQKTMASSNVGSAVDRALELVNKLGVTGFGNKIARSLSPGGMPSDSYDASVATVSAQTAISALNQMRESSPTGGALGNVTDYENKMLASTIAGLHNSQKTEDAEKALIRVKATFLTLLHQRYEGKEGDDARFETELAKHINDITIDHNNKKQGRGEVKYKVTPRN